MFTLFKNAKNTGQYVFDNSSKLPSDSASIEVRGYKEVEPKFNDDRLDPFFANILTPCDCIAHYNENKVSTGIFFYSRMERFCIYLL